MSENEVNLEADYMLTSIATDGQDNFAIGNNIGSVALLDKRRDFKIAKKFVDHLSSITSVAFLHGDTDKFVSSCFISFPRSIYEHIRY